MTILVDWETITCEKSERIWLKPGLASFGQHEDIPQRRKITTEESFGQSFGLITNMLNYRLQCGQKREIKTYFKLN